MKDKFKNFCLDKLNGRGAGDVYLSTESYITEVTWQRLRHICTSEKTGLPQVKEIKNRFNLGLLEAKTLWDFYSENPKFEKEGVNDITYAVITLSNAQKYGLDAEVVVYALRYMKDNPELSIQEALDMGYGEWVK